MNVGIEKIVFENTLLILLGVVYNLCKGDYQAVPSLIGWNLLALIVLLAIGKIMKWCGVLPRRPQGDNLWNETEDTDGTGGGAMDPFFVLQIDLNYDRLPPQYQEPNVRHHLLVVMLGVISLLVGSAVGLYYARNFLD